jgi:Pyruvate/2-oxoglutarate dehydrogenase complex, dihydrolipoamide dehydrogenase (E3) component, and related enzymes
MLYGIVETQRQAQKYKHNGLEDTAHLKVNWHDMMQFKRSYTNQIPGGTENGLTNADIDHIAGTCHFLNAHQIQVNERQISAQYFIIATGAEASIPDIEGSNWLKTSTDFLDEDSLPAKIAFIGGGYVAIELANIAVSAGAEVHIFQHNSRVLRNFPEEYTQKLVSLLTEKGIIFHFNDTITAVKKELIHFKLPPASTIIISRRSICRHGAPRECWITKPRKYNRCVHLKRDQCQ